MEDAWIQRDLPESVGVTGTTKTLFLFPSKMAAWQRMAHEISIAIISVVE